MASLTDPFTEFAAEVADAINDVLRGSIPAASNTGCPAKLRDALEYSLMAPGKRLRPMLVLLAADACGAPLTSAYPAAAAVEMIHAYSLVHDDLPAMDDDDFRRGRPSCHKQFDEATAILVGDALQALAFETLASGFPPQLAARACLELSRAAGAAALVGGQSDDLACEGKPGDFEQLQAIHQRKTGALIRVSLRLGAIAADADEDTIQRMDRFGAHVGTVFQITDDMLDFEGSIEELGKATQKDAERGKLTYPGLLGAEASRNEAAALTAQAEAELAPLGERAERLKAMARFVLERKR